MYEYINTHIELLIGHQKENKNILSIKIKLKILITHNTGYSVKFEHGSANLDYNCL